jgi:hypothetical protein
VSSRFRYFLLFAAGVLILAGMASCKAQPEPSEFLTLPARFADEGPSEPLVALDAFRDESSFYVRYRLGDEILYTGGEWSDRIDLKAIAAGDSQGGPFIVPLQYHQTSEWVDVPDERVSATVLSSEDWQSFRDAFISSILPRTEPVGVALHFFVDDYFLYFDEQGGL